MQKIILAMNAAVLNNSSIEFACYIAAKTKSRLYAVFLEEVKLLERIEIETGDITVTEQVEVMGNCPIALSQVQINVEVFKSTCNRHNVPFSVHIDRGFALREIITESRFADLLITDVNTSFDDERQEGIPSRFVKDLLKQAECPVIISPMDFDSLNEIVFTYDGSESSVFAIKQFAYLFPEAGDTKITLIQILREKTTEITQKEKLKEWLMMRYEGVHFEVLHGDPDEILFERYFTQKNKMLVMGAYGRKLFCFRSTADLVLKTLDIPVFIAHL